MAILALIGIFQVLLILYRLIVHGSFELKIIDIILYLKLSVFVGFHVGAIYYLNYRIGTSAVVIYGMIFFAFMYLLTGDGQTMLKHLSG